MEMVNPLAAYREGWQTSQGLYDTRTQRQAGNALAQGDYRGGANALLRGGMLDEGMQMQAFDQKRQAFDADQQRAEQERAKAAQKQALGTMLDGAQGLRQAPPAVRKQQWIAQTRPMLAQLGVPEELLAQFDASGFSDQELDPFILTLGGELQKPEWRFDRGPDGSLTAYDQNNLGNRQTLQAADPYYAQEREAKIAAIRAQEAQRRAAAAKSNRGPAPRGGGRGRGGALSGSADLPPGFVLE